ncbi:MAG: flagellar basal body P-ring formation chaperone FlgA [Hyphomicrobiaceae bacterium]
MNRQNSSTFRLRAGRIIGLALGVVIAALVALPAFADDSRPKLRTEIAVYSGLVALGDLFENAGPAANAPVFRSPDLGTQGVVSTKRIAAAARKHGLYWDNPRDVALVTVKRPGRLVSLDDIKKAIAKHATRTMGLADASEVAVTFDSRSRPFHVDPRVSGPLVVKQFTASERSGRYHAVVSFDDPDRRTRDRAYSGQAYETTTVVVLAHPIERGATIQPGDVKKLAMPKAQLRTGIITNTDELTGMAAKRNLSADKPVRRSDLEHPKLVERNSLVTISFEMPGLKLKSQGRAQADAALGETVSVLNTRSNRIVQAVVRGPGLVTIKTSNNGNIRRPVLAQNRTTTAGPHSVR